MGKASMPTATTGAAGVHLLAGMISSMGFPVRSPRRMCEVLICLSEHTTVHQLHCR